MTDIPNTESSGTNLRQLLREAIWAAGREVDENALTAVLGVVLREGRILGDQLRDAEAARARAVERAEFYEAALARMRDRLEVTAVRVRRVADQIALDSPWGQSTADRVRAALDTPEPTP